MRERARCRYCARSQVPAQQVVGRRVETEIEIEAGDSYGRPASSNEEALDDCAPGLAAMPVVLTVSPPASSERRKRTLPLALRAEGLAGPTR